MGGSVSLFTKTKNDLERDPIFFHKDTVGFLENLLSVIAAQIIHENYHINGNVLLSPGLLE